MVLHGGKKGISKETYPRPTPEIDACASSASFCLISRKRFALYLHFCFLFVHYTERKNGKKNEKSSWHSSFKQNNLKFKSKDCHNVAGGGHGVERFPFLCPYLGKFAPCLIHKRKLSGLQIGNEAEAEPTAMDGKPPSTHLDNFITVYQHWACEVLLLSEQTKPVQQRP